MEIIVPYNCKTIAEALAKIEHSKRDKHEIIVIIHNKPEKIKIRNNIRYNYLNKTYSLKELYETKKKNFPLFLLDCLTIIIAIPIDILIKLLLEVQKKYNDIISSNV